MDDFIHEKLQNYLHRTECEAYVVKRNDVIIAMLSLRRQSNRWDIKTLFECTRFFILQKISIKQSFDSGKSITLYE